MHSNSACLSSYRQEWGNKEWGSEKNYRIVSVERILPTRDGILSVTNAGILFLKPDTLSILAIGHSLIVRNANSNTRLNVHQIQKIFTHQGPWVTVLCGFIYTG